jgi:LacI family gluconate utilization system Gnt-I transcriptional repressor
LAITPRGPSASVKITDVAAAAGVAPMTVSRVLNTPNRVSGPTSARVREAIERLGYVPNLLAGSLSSRRSRMIAAIVPNIGSPTFSDPIQAFTDVLGAGGYHVMLGLSGYGPGAEEALLRTVLARRPDGVLLTGASHSPAVRRLLRDAGVPVVEIWDATDHPIDMLVGFDHIGLGAAVADFFAARGHTSFAVLAADIPRANLRRQGFLRRVAELGHTVVAERTLPAPSTITDGRLALRAIAELFGPRTALFATSDHTAFGVMVEARALGIAIRDRLAVCGFGNYELSRSSDTPFTTVGFGGSGMGRIAAECLLSRMTGATPSSSAGTAPSPSPNILVPFEIIARAST